ncbi:MAG: hypothetical protein DI562_01610 [Stenotrophomonas acidaminiphila]|uniref:class I SAM-dependent methyltransferase n=1 Tax=Pseudoxanthomonas japonensis TaxID=69284 RepID=UPI000DB48F29|nr:MAG: hypothetical protein DI562_01610 [Stenotrophomonas acidaminiphila]
MNNHWQSFWDGYRNAEAHSEADLFVQVGKTIARQPIPRRMFEIMVERIVDRLELGREDHLLDMCCGNGLVSYELGPVVGHVTAVDFAAHLIAAAKAFKPLPNIDYRVGDVSSPISEMLDATGTEAGMPGKFLMNDALAYFEPGSLDRIVRNICIARGEEPFRFLLTGIPNAARKWNFYDTEERKARHLENLRKGDVENEGMGRWWESSEIEDIAAGNGLAVTVEEQPLAISAYRMDALIWRA